MLSNDIIANIPIETIVQPNRSVLAIWCTNAPSMIEAVKRTFFSKWKLKILATWYWIKVSINFIHIHFIIIILFTFFHTLHIVLQIVHSLSSPDHEIR